MKTNKVKKEPSIKDLEYLLNSQIWSPEIVTQIQKQIDEIKSKERNELMKNVIAKTVALSMAFLLANCQLQKQATPSKAAATSSSTKEAAVWYSTAASLNCVEDFIDALDPSGASGYECKFTTAVNPSGFFFCTPKVAVIDEQTETDKGQKILNETYGWYKYTSGTGGQVTAVRAQWAHQNYPNVHLNGFTIIAEDTPAIGFKICTSRWNNVK